MCCQRLKFKGYINKCLAHICACFTAIYTASLLTLQYLKYIAYQENTETRNKMHRTNDYAAALVVSNSVWLHRWQSARLPRPWDSPGKNTGVGCHFLLQCMKVKSESEVAQSCPTLSEPMDCSPPGFSNHGIFQARVLEWGAIAFSINDYRYLEIETVFDFLLSSWNIQNCQ